jgi:hypothetical protein
MKTMKRMERLLSMSMSLLVGLCLFGSAAARARSAEPVRDLLMALTGDVDLRVVRNSQADPQLTIERGYLSKAQKAKLKKEMAAFGKGRARAEVCVLVEEEQGGFTLLDVLRLNRAEYDEFRALVPFERGAKFRMALNLKEAGITDSDLFLVMSEDELRAMGGGVKDARSAELVREVKTMAQRGRLSFTATLSQLPLSKRKAVATLRTDKGDLGIEVLLDKNMGYTDSDFLILKTPGGQEMRVKLGVLPGASEAVAKLTTRTGMLRQKKVDLSLKSAGFAMEYPETRGRVRALRTETGALAVDKKGYVVAPPVKVRFEPTFAVRRTVSPQCDFEIKYEDAGTTQRLTTFQPYFREDRLRPEKVVTFSPDAEEVVLQYDELALVRNGVVE